MATGSSPPVRGTPRARFQFQPANRFIPARAGNTHPIALGVLCHAVHPRPCGEHNAMAASKRFLYGSSPPVRGTHSCSPSQRKRPVLSARGSSPPVRGTPTTTNAATVSPRFIPARAGNTTLTRRPGFPAEVHPRPCGEHNVVFNTSKSTNGSSPPVRGTHGGYGTGAANQRFIPARAGNTRPRGG